MTKKGVIWKECNTEKVQPEKSGTAKKCNMNRLQRKATHKKIKHGKSATKSAIQKSATCKECNKTKLQYERTQHQKVHHVKNATSPKCNTKRLQDEKSAA